MNALFLIFLGLVGIASAQYSCAPGFCSQTNGLSRGDVLGCLYFCYLDMSLDELIQHVEVDDRYDEWRGTGIDCDLDCFLTVHRDILPACDSELTGAYNALAVLDGDTVSITHLDVDLWYDVLVSVQGTEPINAAGFQTWFLGLYDRIYDPTCTLPYP